MPVVKLINNYAAFLYPDNRPDEARINVYCTDGYRLYILFRREGAALGSNSFNVATKTGVAYEVIGGFDRYLDLLRNEKPVRVTFNPDSTPPSYVVYVSGEPVGEEEGLSG